MRSLLVLVALASCEGNCNAKDAALSAMPVGSLCVADSEMGICVSGTDGAAYVCQISGVFTHMARCARWQARQ